MSQEAAEQIEDLEAAWNEMAAEDARATVPDEEDELPTGESQTESTQEVAATEVDPLAALPDALREEVLTSRKEREAALQRERSAAGRQAAYQKRIAEMEQQLQVVSAQQKVQSPPDDEDAKLIASLREDYPQIAEVLEKRIGSVDKRVEEMLQTRLAPLQDQYNAQRVAQHQAVIESGISQVDQQHPDWREVTASPVFDEWLGKQPQVIRQAVNSWEPSDINYVFDRFKADRKALQQSVTATKQQKLQAAAGVQSRVTPVTVVDEGDAEAAWNALVREDERQRRLARR
jgi:hypothetical protein